jgi:hypothetical protein
MEKTLEAITKWLKESGLVVNQTKKDICLFNKRDCAPISIKVENTVPKNVMNVLGVTIDSKYQWSCNVSSLLHKANTL